LSYDTAIRRLDPITTRLHNVSLALPDVTLQLDLDGVIRGASLANSISTEAVDSWVGRKWADTVEQPGSASVLGMVADARVNGVSDFREVRQRFPSGLELPMEYNTVRLGGQAGLLAVGKNLQAVAGAQSRLILSQHAREQDAWKLRELETRNRLLFDASDDPILLLHADDLHVVEANPAAIRAGALDAGRDFPAAIAPRDRDAFDAMMGQVAEQGRAQGVVMHIGTGSVPWLVRASRAAADPEPIFLLRLSPAAQSARRGATSVEELIERMPDGFALVDEAGRVRRGNRAFFDLVQMTAPAAVIGQPISRWLSQPGADASVLLASLRRHRVVRNFATALHGELGTEASVEISGAADDESGHAGLLLRDVSRRQTAAAASLLAPLTTLDAQIGTTPLLQLVREAADQIERHCIETALFRAAGNRTAAASALGLSRQSLYAKLSRYDITDGA
jgi:transcriptional regulator PpsR